MYKKNKWYTFDLIKGYKQALPPVKKYVLVSNGKNICVGWLKYAAGDKSCPKFITKCLPRPYFCSPFEKREYREILMWNDCLPEDFKYIKFDGYIEENV